jgi:hypothetical protein
MTGDTVYCDGEALSEITVIPSLGGSITWYADPGLISVIGTGPVLTPNAAPGSTTYYVTESAGSCTSNPGMVTITTYPLPSLQISNDTTIIAGETVTLLVTGGSSYIWSTGATTNSITVSPEQNTTYLVTASNAGCNTDATVTVMVLEEENVVYIPNVFSINSSNPEHSRLYAFGKNIESLELIIFDRWGEKIYVTKDANSKPRSSDGLCCAYGEGWDGTYMNTGKPLNTAVFVYKLKVTFTNSEEYFENGNITLLK